MKTEVIMKREIFWKEISQKSKSEFFSATDLVYAWNSWRKQNWMNDFNLSQFLTQKATTEFIWELKKEFGEVLQKWRWRSSHTWVHPLLFIDIALSISPKLKIEVYKWLYDELLKYRNTSWDSYKKMCWALFELQKNKREFYLYIQAVADKIKKHCWVKDWETATEEQLKKRDKIHENIYLLSGVLNNKEEAVRIWILKS